MRTLQLDLGRRRILILLHRCQPAVLRAMSDKRRLAIRYRLVKPEHASG